MLATAVAQHYSSPSAPSATQKPAVAGPGDLDPCASSTKTLKAVFHISVTAKPAVSGPGTLACRYTFANHGSTIVTTATSKSLAKSRPGMTPQQWYDDQVSDFDPASTVDVSGLNGLAAMSRNPRAVAYVDEDDSEAFLVSGEEQSAYQNLLGFTKTVLSRLLDGVEKSAHHKVDPKTIKAFQDALDKMPGDPTVKDLNDLKALAMQLFVLTDALPASVSASGSADL
jgi:hypothetical protein